jgi:hypothetical protein
LTEKQRELLDEVTNMCKENGATVENLAPLYAVIMVDSNPQLTSVEKNYAELLGRQLKCRE